MVLQYCMYTDVQLGWVNVTFHRHSRWLNSQQQSFSSSSNNVKKAWTYTRRRPEFPGRNDVFNKTIAGRRRTLLLVKMIDRHHFMQVWLTWIRAIHAVQTLHGQYMRCRRCTGNTCGADAARAIHAVQTLHHYSVWSVTSASRFFSFFNFVVPRVCMYALGIMVSGQFTLLATAHCCARQATTTIVTSRHCLKCVPSRVTNRAASQYGRLMIA